MNITKEIQQIDIFSLVKQALNNPEKQPTTSYLLEYMLAYTDEKLLITSTEYDLDLVKYSGYLDGNQVFIGLDNQPIPLNENEYKKSWICVDTSTLIGNMLKNEYYKIIEEAKNQLPEHLKNKIISIK